MTETNNKIQLITEAKTNNKNQLLTKTNNKNQLNTKTTTNNKIQLLTKTNNKSQLNTKTTTKNKNQLSTETNTNQNTQLISTSGILTAGQYIQGTNGFKAVMQGDGNFVVYDCNGVSLWSTGTNSGSGYYLSLQGDGNLVLYSSTSAVKWASNSQGHNSAPYTLDMQGDGNLVLYDAAGAAIWSTGTVNKSYACTGVQFCLTSYYANVYNITAGHAREQENAYYQCTMTGTATAGQSVCCTGLKTGPNTYGTNAQLDLVNNINTQFTISSLSTQDGYSFSKFYRASTATDDQIGDNCSDTMDDYDWTSTCDNRLRLLVNDYYGGAEICNIVVELGSYFASDKGHCAYVWY